MKILVAMSGGVDSSVAAFLLKQQGHDITGCTLLLANEGAEGADEICACLGIEHVILDCREAFRRQVVDYFLSEYENGRTPNPCVVCNEKLKFGYLLDYAKAHGFDRLATGHYASIKEYDGKLYLATTDAGKKDQSYFVHRLSKDQLSGIVFPLAPYTKDEIRKIAIENQLPSASKSDSQDVCFISGDYRDFLHEHNVFGSPGDIIYDNKVIASHIGLPNYTIGQRKIGVAWEHPLYVKKIDAKNNTLIVSNNEALFSLECMLSDVCLTYDASAEFSCYIKPRSVAKAEKGKVWIMENRRARVVFDTPMRALTPGQAAVFYTEDGRILGGGIICDE